ncbi:MAG: T9SS type A sorting domain-containing protein, partial [Bacteroidales bacterium]|nr:T9SS type A sorting domain-containing protein [Bacteroidales bacterium]
VYPNPANNIMNVDGGELTIDQIQVFNTMGQAILSKETNSSNLQLNVADYKTGMYFIRMMTNQGMVIKKFQVNN